MKVTSPEPHCNGPSFSSPSPPRIQSTPSHRVSEAPWPIRNSSFPSHDAPMSDPPAVSQIASPSFHPDISCTERLDLHPDPSHESHDPARIEKLYRSTSKAARSHS